jgi:hypothetical protein
MSLSRLNSKGLHGEIFTNKIALRQLSIREQMEGPH